MKKIAEFCKHFDPYIFGGGGNCMRKRSGINPCNADLFGKCDYFVEKPGMRQHPEDCRHYEKRSHTCGRKDRYWNGILLVPPSHCSLNTASTHCDYFEQRNDEQT